MHSFPSFAALLERRFWLFASALIACLGAVQVTSIVGETQTWDEAIHIVGGYSYLVTGDYRVNPEHPPLGKILCAAPLRLLNVTLDTSRYWEPVDQYKLGRSFVYDNSVPADTILLVSRSVTIVLTLLFALWLALWTRKRFGPPVGLAALVLFSFDPNIIAHGRYVTTDLVASLFVFLTLTLWIEYLLDARAWYLLVLSGLSLGCALSSKYSTFFLVPLMLVLYWVRVAFSRARKEPPGRLGLWHYVRSVLALAALSVCVIALVYFPEVARWPHMDALRPQLRALGALSRTLVWISRKLHLSAWSYLIGLDRLSEHGFRGHASYLLGQISQYGWWYYFPVAFALKTPVGVLLLLVVTPVLAVFGRRRLAPYSFPLLSISLSAIVFFAMCLTSPIDVGLRHVLPLYPLLYVAIAAVWVHAGPAALRGLARLALVALLVLVAGESLAIYPYYLSFFNFACGGPARGPQYLLDSNIDWGQDGKRLAAWMHQNGVSRVRLFFFGGDVPIERYGVTFDHIPDTYEEQKNLRAVFAISVTHLYGQYIGPARLRFFREIRPTDRVGYSIYIFDRRNF